MSKAPSWNAQTAQSGRLNARALAATPLARFEACLPDTLSQECPDQGDWSNPANFSDDPHDPGGATMCGITQAEYDSYRQSCGEPNQSVELMSRAEGQAIYQMSYWQPHCPQLPAGLDLSFFDSSVNMGPREAIRILQFALNLGEAGIDGIWGPQTAGAVAGIADVATVIEAFTARRQAVYRTFATFQYFGDDWIRRAKEIGDESLQMIVTT
jgi:lysozyme family protein